MYFKFIQDKHPIVLFLRTLNIPCVFCINISLGTLFIVGEKGVFYPNKIFTLKYEY